MKVGVREMIFFVVLAGLLGCVYFFVFNVRNAKRESLIIDTQAKRQALANLQHATEGIGDIKLKTGELQQAIAYFESKLPQQREVDRILKEVSQISQDEGLVTKSFRSSKSDAMANYFQQPIRMTLSGDFAGYYNFLLKLEKLPRLTRIMQMDLEKVPMRDGLITAEITLNIFFEPEDAPQQTALSN